MYGNTGGRFCCVRNEHNRTVPLCSFVCEHNRTAPLPRKKYDGIQAEFMLECVKLYL